VNDAPALKRADVGVAMGRAGTEAAKQAAKMVLADDNFASIASAVEEGRTVHDNLKKAILFILPTNAAQAFAIVAAILLGLELPITPLQILWVNMVTAVTLALALAFEAAEGDVMARPPRRPDEPLLSGLLAWRVLLVSLLLVAATFGLFLWRSAAGDAVEAARTAAVNGLVAGQAFYLASTRRLSGPPSLRGARPALVAVALVLGLQLLFTYAPPLERLFDTAALGAEAWLGVIAAGVLVLLAVELEKRMLNASAGARGSPSWTDARGCASKDLLH
jgi:magnesium-transporting ATPase (P-type)